jgi:opacity protein-like surface antigen
MKTMKLLAVASAALVTVVSYGQTTTPATTMTMRPSTRDDPGTLGHAYTELNYSWLDFHRDAGPDADGYMAGISANTPLGRGLDLGLGYNYTRLNHHRNPFSGSDFDARYHGLATAATFYAPVAGVKPFVTGGIGYQWSRGDIQSLRTYDHEWVWGASGGVQVALGRLSVTPRVTFSDTMRNNSIGAWHYGGEAHTWFNEKWGGFFDATFHEPRRGGGSDYWTYTGGLRLRF